MNTHNAIMKAADSIRDNPGLFGFMQIGRPDPDCGSPGCAIGWIGYHMGFTTDGWYTGVDGGKYQSFTDGLAAVAEAICPFDGYTVPDMRFYNRMDEINSKWRANAYECSKTLRGYATQYHPIPHTVPCDNLSGIRHIWENPAPVVEPKAVAA
jgi:hypothetical protein